MNLNLNRAKQRARNGSKPNQISSEWSLSRTIKKLPWFIYQYSSLRLIWHTIHPPIKDKDFVPASSFVIRATSAWLVIFSIAFSRYELSVTSIESVYSSLVEEFSSDKSNSTLQEMVNLQSQAFPKRPEFGDLKSTIYTALGINDTTYIPIVDRVARFVERNIDKVSSPSLRDLHASNLRINGVPKEYTFNTSTADTLFIWNGIDSVIFLNGKYRYINLYEGVVRFSNALANVETTIGKLKGASHSKINFTSKKKSKASISFLRGASLFDSYRESTFTSDVPFSLNSVDTIDFRYCFFDKRVADALFDVIDRLSFVECKVIHSNDTIGLGNYFFQEFKEVDDTIVD